MFEKDPEKRCGIYEMLQDPWVTCGGREMVDLDLEGSSTSSLRTSYEEVQAKPYWLTSNLHTTFREDEIDIGTINDESEDNVEESKDGEAMPPTSKSATMTSDGEELKSEEDPVRKSTL